jgi:transposase
LERGARLVFESGRPIAHVAADLGVPSETLRKYVRQVEANEGRRPDLLSREEREEIRKLRRENSELRRANEILKAASVFFAGELDPHRPR